MKKLLLIAASLFFIASCGTSINRVQSGTQPDLSGYWNAIDVKIVCEALISECLSSPRVDQAVRQSGNRKPVVIVGRFRNESDEHIDTEIISSIMESVIFNSGKLNFVAPQGLRQELRDERHDQLLNASNETAAALGREVGADYMLTGSVRTIVDREGNRTVRTYFVSAELTNIETLERMWLGYNSEITKIITRPRNTL
ncbi:MAG: penicillin-binding protein activator LpoB [Treponema sp.]|nr:penicillin-binding protein activator LpoB [Treponema sp.]